MSIEEAESQGRSAYARPGVDGPGELAVDARHATQLLELLLKAQLRLAQLLAQRAQLRRLHVPHVLEVLHHLRLIMCRQITPQHRRRTPERALHLACHSALAERTPGMHEKRSGTERALLGKVRGERAAGAQLLALRTRDAHRGTLGDMLVHLSRLYVKCAVHARHGTKSTLAPLVRLQRARTHNATRSRIGAGARDIVAVAHVLVEALERRHVRTAVHKVWAPLAPHCVPHEVIRTVHAQRRELVLYVKHTRQLRAREGIAAMRTERLEGKRLFDAAQTEEVALATLVWLLEQAKTDAALEVVQRRALHQACLERRHAIRRCRR